MLETCDERDPEFDFPLVDHLKLLISNYPVMFFGNSSCNEALMAEIALNKTGIQYTIYDLIHVGDDAEDWARELSKMTGQVAEEVSHYIFIGGKYFGNNDTLQKAIDDGKIAGIFEAAGAE